MSGTRTTVGVTALVVLLAGCGSSGRSPSVARPPDDRLQGTLTVLAASSLTESFGDIATAFESGHKDVDVVITFEGSSRLAAAIVEGAPADLFASADEVTLQRVAEAGLTNGPRRRFATNILQIVVPSGNPLGIASLADLTGTGLSLALCAAAVPCGRYAAAAFDRAGLAVPAAGDQGNVRGVLTQVQLGEADAGIVYRTDVLAADGVEGIALPFEQQVQATYLAAVLAGASNPDAAVAFADFLTGAEAQRILERAGFGLP